MADVSVNLLFTANAEQAKAQIKSLQQALNNLTKNQGGNSDLFNLSPSIQKATQAASQLKATLSSAINVNTGQLDLSKFSQGLKESGMTLGQYRQQLEQLGPEGTSAFAQVAKSITSAQVPIQKTTGLLHDFGVTLKNTAKWQISSSILHGFMGAVSSAWHYAQDLNESLNNIRIVTGYSTDQMAKFAVEANSAAKALSTTTTAYTDASLIYYQQGLNDQQVKERTDVTIKMANVARESATKVSDQMTAIWNNFDDGSHSLEYYADVMTKLGATTAASTAEIATGLEKFAAISHTVGLSYEYATAAVTTLVDKTRQSADTIGTSFRTIFSRLQGLKLGDTLEDGTDLNKYSEALKTVGVDVKDANGNLKEMDVILDDLSEKWSSLNKDEQVALAQTVGGARQYASIIALMENYDFFKENVDLAKNATGSLQEQADIYAESWEAASKRVKASLETIYANLINDKGFIRLTNGIAKALDLLGDFIKAIGGLPGVLSVIGAIAIKVFQNDIAKGLRSLELGFTRASREAARREQITQQKMEAAEELGKLGLDDGTNAGAAQQKAYAQQSALQKEIIGNADRLSEAQLRQLSTESQIVEALQQQAIAQAEIADTEEDKVLASTNKLLNLNEQVKKISSQSNKGLISRDTINTIQEVNTAFGQTQSYIKTLTGLGKELGTGLSNSISVNKDKVINTVDTLKSRVSDLKAVMAEKTDSGIFGESATKAVSRLTQLEEKLQSLSSQLNKTGKNFSAEDAEAFNRELQGISEGYEEVTQAVNNFNNAAQDGIAKNARNIAESVKKPIEGLQGVAEQAASELNTVAQSSQNAGLALENMGQKSGAAEIALEQIIAKAINLTQKVDPLKATIGAVGHSIMTLGMIVNSVSNVIETFLDPDATGLEKVKTVIMSLLGLLPMVIPMIFQIKSAIQATGAAATAAGIEASLAWLWVTLAVAAVAALVALVINIVQAVNNAETESDKKLNRLKKTIEELETASENVKQEIEDIKNAIKGYDEAVEKLSQCTRGTQEWYEALNNVNNILLELMGKYPDLAKVEGLFDRDPNTGMRTVNKEKLQGYLDDRQNDVNALDAAKISTQNDQLETEIQSNKEALVNSMPTSYIHPNDVNQLSNIPGAVHNVLLKNFDDLANLTADEFQAKLKEIFSDFSGTEDFFQALEPFREKITAIANESGAVADKIKTSNEIIAQANIDFTQDEYKKGIAGAITAMIGKNFDQIFDDKKEEISENLKKYSEGKIDNKNSDEAKQLQHYIDVMNENLGTSYRLANKAFEGSGDERNVRVVQEGQAQKDATEWSVDFIASTVAAAEALEEMGAAANNVRDILSKIKLPDQFKDEGKFDSDIVTDIMKYISTGNMGDTSKKNLTALQALGERQGGDYRIKQFFGGEEAFKKYAKAMFPEIEDEEEAVQAALDAIRNAISTALGGIADAFNNTSKSVQNAWNSIKGSIEDNLSENQTKQLASYMQSAFENNGSAGLDWVTKLFGKFGDNADEVLDMLGSIDLQSASIADLEEAIKDAGLSGVVTAEQLQSLADVIRDLSDPGSLESLQKTYAEKSSITKGLDTGDTISKADFDTLDLDPSIANQYFAEMADGTYKLIGDAQEFQSVINEINLQPFQDKLNSIQEDINKYAGFGLEGSYDLLNANAMDVAGSKQVQESSLDPQQVMASFANKQLDYLEGAGYEAEGFDSAQLRANIENGEDLENTYNAIADAIAKCGDQSEAFKEKQKELKEEAEHVKNILDQQKITNMIEESGLDEQMVRDVAKAFQSMNDVLKDNEKLATQVAIRYIRLQEAIKDLNKHQTDYKQTLKDLKSAQNEADRAIIKNSDGYKGLQKSLAGLLGTSEELIKQTNKKGKSLIDMLDPKEITAAANGDVKAIEGIRKKLIALQADINVISLKGLTKELAGLKEGKVFDIDNTPFLKKLIESQLAAGATADDINNLLGAFNVDANVEPFKGSMAEMKAEASKAGTSVIADTSFEQEIQSGELEQKEDQVDVAFNEEITSAAHPATNLILKDGAEEAVEVPVVTWEFDKRVTPTTVTATGEKTTKGASVKTSNKAGKSADVNGVKITDAHKSTGSKPSSTTCFVAGTLITTGNGFKNIEDIQIGDIVLSYNEELQKNEYGKVLQTMIHTTYENIYKLQVEDETIEATGNHKILINRNVMLQWLRVDQTQIGDKVLFADGTLHEIKNIEIDTRLETVYNFEVSDNHNYYVGKNQILAHNKGSGGCFEAGTLISTIDGFKNIEDIQIGNIVLSYNEVTKQNEYSEVLQTMIHDVKENIYRLYIENEILTVTGIHRFLILRNNLQSWIHAKDLIVGDKVLFADGTLHEIHSLTIKEEIMRVYNFEVSKNHNYYVGQNQILAHNKGGCFVGGTLVLEINGLKPIEEIKKDDIVLSYNEETKQNEYSKVLQTMIHIMKENIYSLFIEDDILNVTGIHRFLILRDNKQSWIPAENLQIGDQVLFADGEWHYIKQILTKEQFVTVYNFEVANNHNYYVGKNQILAHNKGCFEAGTLIALEDKEKKIEDIKIGDVVLSYNEQTKQNEYSEVLQTMIHILKEDVYTLYIKNDKLKVTDIHKFFVLRDNKQSWIPAKELQVGDKVLFDTGQLEAIQKIDVEQKFVTVYNFEVANNHNYYVGNNHILAHNKGCFEAGTLVTLEDGVKPIEEIKKGDIVLSYNEETQQNEYSKVLQTMIHILKEKIYTLKIENETLKVTDIHRFFILRNNKQSWIPAEELQIGDQVFFSNGTLHMIEDINVEEKFDTVYNFEVANNHNYYVGENEILVHNKGCFEAGTLITKDTGFESIEKIKIGDVVLSYNETTKKNEYSEVVDTMIHIIKDKIYHLYIENDILNVTDIHKFLIIDNKLSRWIEAQYLQVGDYVLLADGTIHQIQKIKIEEKFVTVYNFEVADNHNYYVGQNQILAHNKGSGKAATPAEKKKYTKKDDIVERYKKTENQLKTINNNLEKQNGLTDLIYGPNKINKMKKILDLMDLQIEKQKALAKEAKDYINLDKKSLSEAGQVMGFKFTFDKDGYIDNLKDIQESYYSQLHAMEEKYNNFATKEEQDEYEKSTIQPFQENWEDVTYYISKYEESLDKFNEAQQEIFNLQIEKFNKQLEIIQEAYTIKFDINEKQFSYIEKLFDRLEDKAFSTAQKVNLLNKELSMIGASSTLRRQSIIDTFKTGIFRTGKDNKPETLEEVLRIKFKGSKNIEKDINDYITNLFEKPSVEFWKKWNLTPQANEWLISQQEAYSDYYDKLLEEKEQIDGLLGDVYDRYTEAIDKHTEHMDRLLDRYDKWASIVEMFGSSRLFGDDAIRLSRQLRQQQKDMYLERLKQDTQVIENNKKLFEIAQNTRQVQDKKINPQIREERAKLEKTKLAQRDKNREQWQGLIDEINKKEASGKKLTDDEINRRRFYEAALKGQTTYIPWVDGHNAPKESKYLVDSTLGEDQKYHYTRRTKPGHEGEKIAVANSQLWDYNILIGKQQELQDRIEKINKGINPDSGKAFKGDQADVARKQKEYLATANEQLQENAKLMKNYHDAQTKINELEAEREKLKEQELAIEEDRAEAEQQRLSDFIDYLSVVKDSAEATIEETFQAAEARINKYYKNLDEMKNAFDWGAKATDRYLADYEKIYELNKLNRELEKKMDESDNLKVKEKLAIFQERILNASKENVKMSQYDLEYMQKQYDLEVARIALEEAQNAKTQVRLTRDTEGNFSYVYTADEDKTAEAQQKYEDALNNVLKLSNDYQKQMLEQRISMEQEYWNAIAELEKDLTLNDEERARRKQIIDANYLDQMAYFRREEQKAAFNNKEDLLLYDKYYGTLNNDLTEAAGIQRQFSDEWLEGSEERRNEFSRYVEIARMKLDELDKTSDDYVNKFIKRVEKEEDILNGLINTTAEGATANFAGIITNATEQFLPQYEGIWTNTVKEAQNACLLTSRHIRTLEDDIKKGLSELGIEIDDNKNLWEQLGSIVLEQSKSSKKESQSIQNDIVETGELFQQELFDAQIAITNWYKLSYTTWQKNLENTQKNIDLIQSYIEKAAGITDSVLTISTKTSGDMLLENTKTDTKGKGNPGKTGGDKGTGGNPPKDDGGKGDDSAGGNDDSGTGTVKKYLYADKSTATVENLPIYANSWAEGRSTYSGKIKIDSYSDESVVKGGRHYNNIGQLKIHISSIKGDDLGWVYWSQLKAFNPTKFDTGGYTGRWGADGRWALLHQKELILNAQDTENMLAAVKTVRQIAEMVDLQAQQANLAGQYALALGQFTGTRQAQQVDQNVHITAEFPNVQDHNEIEMALSSLINRASQFAWQN